MGKGDRKTRKGKINRGSYGVTRKRSRRSPAFVSTAKPTKAAKATPEETKAEAPKKAVSKKTTAKTTTAKKSETKATKAATTKKKPAAKKTKP